MRDLALEEGFSAQNFSHRLSASSQMVENRTTIRSGRSRSIDGLSQKLCERPQVIEYRIMPTGE